MRAAVLIRRPQFAKLYLEDGRTMFIKGNDVKNVLGYAEWGDIGELFDTPKGIKFRPHSDEPEYTFIPYKTTGKEMVIREQPNGYNDT